MDNIKIINAWINDLAETTVRLHENGNKECEITANMLNLALCIKHLLTDDSYRTDWIDAIEGCNKEENASTVQEAYRIFETLPYLSTEFLMMC